MTTYDYNDIALEDGRQMMMDISAKALDAEELPIITDIEEGVQTEERKEADQTETEHFLEIYPCIEKEDGSVKLSSAGSEGFAGYVKAGTELKPLVTVNDGYYLEGFYTDISCENRYEASKMPDGAQVLYAKLIVNDTGIVITGQPQDGEYDTGDAAQALCVTVEQEEGCRYQWYRYTDKKENASAVSGAVSNTYIPDTFMEGTYYYFVRISRKSGEQIYTLDSDSAAVRVSKKTVLGAGDCGNGVSWAVSIDGILTVSGTGAMEDYSAGTAPWAAYADSIVEAVVKQGVEHIGNFAFANCPALKSITIGNSVQTIGKSILSGCSSLEAAAIPFVGASREAAGTEDAVLGHLFGMASEGTVQYFPCPVRPCRDIATPFRIRFPKLR